MPGQSMLMASQGIFWHLPATINLFRWARLTAASLMPCRDETDTPIALALNKAVGRKKCMTDQNIASYLNVSTEEWEHRFCVYMITLFLKVLS